MTIDRDVIADLLPLYRAGIASPASRALVEGWLASHPGETDGPAQRGLEDVSAPARAIAEARRRARLRRRLLALAATLTAIALTTRVTFGSGRLPSVRLLAFDHPLPFLAAGVAALAAWLAYWRVRSRVE